MTTSTGPATREFEGTAIPLPGTYTIDASHSRVGFVAKHLVVSKVRGRFERVRRLADLRREPARVHRRGHDPGRQHQHRRQGPRRPRPHRRLPPRRGAPDPVLQDHVAHPKGNEFVAAGELTIRGVTKPVELDLEFEGVVVDPWGNEKVVLSAETEIDREEYGVSWNQALETGGVLVGKKVKLEIEVPGHPQRLTRSTAPRPPARNPRRNRRSGRRSGARPDRRSVAWPRCRPRVTVAAPTTRVPA